LSRKPIIYAIYAILLLPFLWYQGALVVSADDAWGPEPCGMKCAQTAAGPTDAHFGKTPGAGECCCGGPVSCCDTPRRTAAENLPAFVFTLPKDEKTKSWSVAFSAAVVQTVPVLHDNGPFVEVRPSCAGPPVSLFLLNASFLC